MRREASAQCSQDLYAAISPPTQAYKKNAAVHAWTAAWAVK